MKGMGLMQVEQLLLSEPDNQEYEDIYHSLTEAITLTEGLLKEAGHPSGTGSVSVTGCNLQSQSELLFHKLANPTCLAENTLCSITLHYADASDPFHQSQSILLSFPRQARKPRSVSLAVSSHQDPIASLAIW